MPHSHDAVTDTPEKLKSYNTVTKRLAEKARRNIRVDVIIKNLNACVDGTGTMDTSQIRAAQILLDRTMPTLQSIETTSNDVQDLSAFLTQAAEIAKQLQDSAEGKEKLAAARKAVKESQSDKDSHPPAKPGVTRSQAADGSKAVN